MPSRSRRSCFNPHHHTPHKREEMMEDVFQFCEERVFQFCEELVFQFCEELSADTGVNLDPQAAWNEVQRKITFNE